MGSLSFRDAHKHLMSGDELDVQEDIPRLVWLLENPDSPFHLAGSVRLFGHDCIHTLLGLGITPREEAFVLGFSMGSDCRSTRLGIGLFKVASRWLYPGKFRFNAEELKIFDRAFEYGRSRPVKCVNLVDFDRWMDSDVEFDNVREVLGIDLNEVQALLGCN